MSINLTYNYRNYDAMQNLRSDPRQFSNLVMVDIYLFQIIIKKLKYY